MWNHLFFPLRRLTPVSLLQMANLLKHKKHLHLDKKKKKNNNNRNNTNFSKKKQQVLHCFHKRVLALENVHSGALVKDKNTQGFSLCIYTSILQSLSYYKMGYS